MSDQPIQDRRTNIASLVSTSDPVDSAINFAEPADAFELAAVHAEALPPGWPVEDLAAYCGRCDRLTLKAGRSGMVFGFLTLRCAADEAEILTLAVRATVRRRKIASSLLSDAVRFCRSRAIAHIYLEVAEDNVAARALYEKHSFRIFGHRARYYVAKGQPPGSALIMRLDICQDVSQGGESGVTG